MFKQTLFNFLILAILIYKVQMVTIESYENNKFDKEENHKILSRKRRYLTFPEGSSLQLG